MSYTATINSATTSRNTSVTHLLPHSLNYKQLSSKEMNVTINNGENQTRQR